MANNLLLEAVLSLASERGVRRIAVVGPTASGKSALAMSLAEHWGCSILSADARQIYRGMDIGTAKPTREERLRVHHDLIDVEDPSKQFTVARYVELARPILEKAESEDAPIVIVGGTGLYVDALTQTYVLPPGETTPAVQEDVATLSLDELLARLDALDPAEGQRVDRMNRRRVERALAYILSTGHALGASASRGALRAGLLVIGLDLPHDMLLHRIEDRVRTMFEVGLVDELRHLVHVYGEAAPGLDAIGYRELLPVLHRKDTVATAKNAIVTHTRQYAKRQRTWFRRNPEIVWMSPDR